MSSIIPKRIVGDQPLLVLAGFLLLEAGCFLGGLVFLDIWLISIQTQWRWIKTATSCRDDSIVIGNLLGTRKSFYGD